MAAIDKILKQRRDIVQAARDLCDDIAGPIEDGFVRGSVEIVDVLVGEIERLRAENDKFKPLGWITTESLQRLALAGGNGSKGTVPIHAQQSRVAWIPVFRANGT